MSVLPNSIDMGPSEVAQERGFMDLHFPARSFKRTALIAGGCVLTLVSALHFEIGRLQDTQVSGVKTEVVNQGAKIGDPLMAEVRGANNKLDICQRVAEDLGITETESAQERNDRAAAPITSTTSTTSTSITTPLTAVVASP